MYVRDDCREQLAFTKFPHLGSVGRQLKLLLYMLHIFNGYHDADESYILGCA